MNMKTWKLYGILHNGDRQFLGEYKSRQEAETWAKFHKSNQKLIRFANEAKKFVIEKEGK